MGTMSNVKWKFSAKTKKVFEVSGCVVVFISVYRYLYMKISLLKYCFLEYFLLWNTYFWMNYLFSFSWSWIETLYQSEIRNYFSSICRMSCGEENLSDHLLSSPSPSPSFNFAITETEHIILLVNICEWNRTMEFLLF